MRKEINYIKVAEIFNASGSKAACAYLQDTYDYKNPQSLLSKMKNLEKYGYNKETKKFTSESIPETSIFLDLEDLYQKPATQKQYPSSPELSLEYLLNELLKEKFMEFSKYVQISRVNSSVTINKTALVHDGYKVAIY